MFTLRRKHSHSFCSFDCKNLFYVGENHPNWVKDRSCLKAENRRIRYSTKMKEWRLAVFERDDFTCTGKSVTLNAHHIKKFCDFSDLRFDVSNGATLCVHCHTKVTGKEREFESFLLETIKPKF